MMILVGATVLAYSNSFYGTFLYDDHPNIVENPSIQSFENLWNSGVGEISPSMIRREIGKWSFGLNYYFGELDPWGYHLVNLLIHLSAGLVLFLLIRDTCELADHGLRKRYASWIAFCVTLLWMVHPLQTESVTYIFQRLESLSSLFYLLSIYALVKSRRATAPVSWETACCAFAVLGGFTKEILVSLPLVALLYDRVFLSGSWRQIYDQHKRFYLALVTCGSIVIIRSIGAVFLPQDSRLLNHGLDVFKAPSTWEFLRSQPGVILHYLKLAVWPDELCLDYLWPVATDPWEIYGKGLVILLLLGGALWMVNGKFPKLGFLGLAFFLLLAPTSSFKPLMLAFEHRMYLPLACVLSLLVLLLFKFLEKGLGTEQPTRVAISAVLVCGVWAAILGWKTFDRNRDYYSVVSMWSDIAEKSPHNPHPYVNIGVYYGNQGDLQRAEEYFRQALQIAPHYGQPWQNLGQMYANQGKFEQSIECFERTLEITKNSVYTWKYYGDVLVQVRRFQDAIAAYREALKLRPEFVRARSDLAHLYLSLGEKTKAIEQFQTLLKTQSNHVPSLMALARFSSEQGDFAQAEKYLRDAKQAAPDNGSINFVLANLYLQKQQIREAERELKLALEHSEGFESIRSPVLFTQARIARTNRNIKSAVLLLEQAVKEAPQNWEAVIELADCYLELGEANRASQLVLKLEETIPEEPRVQILRKRLSAKMPPQGDEPKPLTDRDDNDLQQSIDSGAAESGAVGPDSCQIDSRLQEIIEAWPSLSPGIQVELMKLIQSE